MIIEDCTCARTEKDFAASVKKNESWERLSLHCACEKNAPLQVLEFLVQKYPDSVKKKETWGKLPLHCACENNAPLQVL